MSIKSLTFLFALIFALIFVALPSCETSSDSSGGTLGDDDQDDDSDDDSDDDDSDDDDDDNDDDDDVDDAEAYSGTWIGEVEIQYYESGERHNDDLRHVIQVDESGLFIGSLSFGEGMTGGDAPFQELTEGEIDLVADWIIWSMEWTSSGTGKTYKFDFNGQVFSLTSMSGSFNAEEKEGGAAYAFGTWSLLKSD